MQPELEAKPRDTFACGHDVASATANRQPEWEVGCAGQFRKVDDDGAERAALSCIGVHHLLQNGAA